MPYYLILVLAVVATSQAWVLQTNFERVIPGRTQNVELLCQQEDLPVDSVDIKKIARIRMTKLDTFGSKTTFADINLLADTKHSSDDDVIIKSDISEKKGAFLKVAWSMATNTTAGEYGCEISGFNRRKNLVNVEVKTVLITEMESSTGNASELIQSLTSEYLKTQKSLESEIGNLTILVKKQAKILETLDTASLKTILATVEKDITGLQDYMVNAIGACPLGWFAYKPRKTCVWLSSVKEDYLGARSYCQSLGGDLVKIPDPFMNAFLTNLITKDKENYWIGLNDIVRENVYVWNDETLPATYSIWTPGRPDNHGNEDCYEIRYKDEEWNDADCYREHKFVCQKAAV